MIAIGPARPVRSSQPKSDAAIKRGSEPRFQDVKCLERSGDLATDAKHVETVVRASQPAHVSAGAERRANARVLVGDDAHPDSGRANQNASARLAADDAGCAQMLGQTS